MGTMTAEFVPVLGYKGHCICGNEFKFVHAHNRTIDCDDCGRTIELNVTARELRDEQIEN